MDRAWDTSLNFFSAPDILEPLTKPLDMAPGDESAAELQEGLVDVGAALITDTQTAHAVQPGESALDNPAVSAQALAGFDAPAGNAGANTATLQILAQVGEIVALVGMHLLGSPARMTRQSPHQRDGFEYRDEALGVVPVGAREHYRERKASGIDGEVVLAAQFAPVGRIRAGFRAPWGSGMLAPSTETRVQSIWA